VREALGSPRFDPDGERFRVAEIGRDTATCSIDSRFYRAKRYADRMSLQLFGYVTVVARTSEDIPIRTIPIDRSVLAQCGVGSVLHGSTLFTPPPHDSNERNTSGSCVRVSACGCPRSIPKPRGEERGLRRILPIGTIGLLGRQDVRRSSCFTSERDESSRQQEGRPHRGPAGGLSGESDQGRFGRSWIGFDSQLQRNHESANACCERFEVETKGSPKVLRAIVEALARCSPAESRYAATASARSHPRGRSLHCAQRRLSSQLRAERGYPRSQRGGECSEDRRRNEPNLIAHRSCREVRSWRGHNSTQVLS